MLRQGYAAEEIKIKRATKSLIKGGMGGRISYVDTDWNYFANINTVISYPLSPAEREMRETEVCLLILTNCKNSQQLQKRATGSIFFRQLL